MPTTSKPLIEPVRLPSSSWPTPCGRRATMPAMMISETPLPMPRLVICSPIHIRNKVPPTRLTVPANSNRRPGWTTALMPWRTDCDSRPRTAR